MDRHILAKVAERAMRLAPESDPYPLDDYVMTGYDPASGRSGWYNRDEGRYVEVDADGALIDPAIERVSPTAGLHPPDDWNQKWRGE